MSVLLRDILSHDFPAKHADKTSGQCIKMTAIVIWAHQNSPLAILDLARMVGCGERTVYRSLRVLHDHGYIYSRPSDDRRALIYSFGYLPAPLAQAVPR